MTRFLLVGLFWFAPVLSAPVRPRQAEAPRPQLAVNDEDDDEDQPQQDEDEDQGSSLVPSRRVGGVALALEMSGEPGSRRT